MNIDHAEHAMLVSVIVVTYNRARLVERCLESVRAQHPSVSSEVIVIDNGSTQDEWEYVRERFGRHLQMVRSEKRIALARCKELALAHAHGEIIAFTDDDCRVGKRWLAALVEALTHADIAFGDVLPEEGVSFPWWWLPSLDWLIGVSRQPRPSSYPLGGNVAYKREFFESILPDACPRKAQPASLLPYAEDIVRTQKAIRRGATIAKHPEMVVYHHLPAARFRASFLIKRSIDDGRAWAVWDRAPLRLMRALAKIIINPVRLCLCADLNFLFKTISELSYVAYYLCTEKVL